MQVQQVLKKLACTTVPLLSLPAAAAMHMLKPLTAEDKYRSDTTSGHSTSTETNKSCCRGAQATWHTSFMAASLHAPAHMATAAAKHTAAAAAHTRHTNHHTLTASERPCIQNAKRRATSAHYNSSQLLSIKKAENGSRNHTKHATGLQCLFAPMAASRHSQRAHARFKHNQLTSSGSTQACSRTITQQTSHLGKKPRLPGTQTTQPACKHQTHAPHAAAAHACPPSTVHSRMHAAPPYPPLPLFSQRQAPLAASLFHGCQGARVLPASAIQRPRPRRRPRADHRVTVQGRAVHALVKVPATAHSAVLAALLVAAEVVGGGCAAGAGRRHGQHRRRVGGAAGLRGALAG
ncbi:hypothetical protein COO60DRAFT_1495639 [Scenedesmus sp. NREL 46B-D3]|nr:hypothetical protein COO60DRAFT_1495639 [Scenedesmus sp. NREL 46B-D3]